MLDVARGCCIAVYLCFLPFCALLCENTEMFGLCVPFFPSAALNAGNDALCVQSIERTHSDLHGKNVSAIENNDVCS